MIYFVAGAEFAWETHAVVQTYARAALVTAYKFVVGERKATHPPGTSGSSSGRSKTGP